VRLTDDGRPVVYTGDDERFDYFYKFVGSKRMRHGSSRSVREHNLSLLDEGTLYVARLTGDSDHPGPAGARRRPAPGRDRRRVGGETGEQLARRTREDRAPGGRLGVAQGRLRHRGLRLYGS
jgi:hypothetical protein